MSLLLGGKFTDVENNEPLRASDQAARMSFPPPVRGSVTLEAAVAVPLCSTSERSAGSAAAGGGADL